MIGIDWQAGRAQHGRNLDVGVVTAADEEANARECILVQLVTLDPERSSRN